MEHSPDPAKLVDFSHGDVTAFPPLPTAVDAVARGVHQGGDWAYTPYRGNTEAREHLAQHIGHLTGRDIDTQREILVTPGTQASLFLALSSVVERGNLVAIGSPDYFAYRKIIQYLEAKPVDVRLRYRTTNLPGEFDLDQLRDAFARGARVFVFSNPNNPVGVVYSREHLDEVRRIAEDYGALVIVDQLYCRQILDGRPYTHLRALSSEGENCVTVLGPSKTESLSGYRLGVTVGPAEIIDRMEALQGLVTLRAPGYSQAALTQWLVEPKGWLAARIAAHQQIRDDIMRVVASSEFISARPTEGGSYLFVHVSTIRGRVDEFVTRLRGESQVIVTRGLEFGNYTDEVRLNFSQDRSNAVAAVERMTDFAARF
jgi:aspartate/methionine/tyrosine aminotransferase